MIIYLSGKITGNPEYKSDFSSAAEDVRREFPEAVILNPARMFPPGMEPRHYMALCIEVVKLADMVVLLDGWEESPGAQIEKAVADYCGIATLALDELCQTAPEDDVSEAVKWAEIGRFFVAGINSAFDIACASKVNSVSSDVKGLDDQRGGEARGDLPDD